MNKTQNIKLSLLKDLLQKIKHIAINKQTSVSGLLTKTLEEIVKKENLYEKARLHHIDILENNIDLGTEGKTTWNREDLYER
ncbi:CopG family transcriptional regulator [Thermoanaerobacterium sp. CMT5567-10]|uniref:CopG family transcriptional regulator n=1 Tax=Thermoanaerobacterium sp. CMT5567-10 TaxID=3061989 RepID=UPI0026DF2970|nr:CopG family transcriptional regulator [Thermoanaerobacterium sp. CMT5567-10]WKV08637.1 CopG family transcriptional regulator [Thermoanaerobacterium sp. CMT5567-10]